MTTSNSTGSVTNVTSEGLRQYLDSHKAHEYSLIDVRQPEEYEQGHIPGARLMPLGELDSHADELRKLAGRDLIFYCKGGVRSARASAWAAGAQALPRVHNLLGGFSGWQGPALAEFPRLKSFDLSGSADAVLRQALELEKGTHRLYELLAKEFSTGIVGETLAALVSVELAHGESIHRMLNKLLGKSSESFEILFNRLKGDIIEDGIPFEAVVERAKELGMGGGTPLLELALEIELGAYDLYKNLAGSVADAELRHSLEELAQQEKAHADRVLRAIGAATKESIALLES